MRRALYLAAARALATGSSLCEGQPPLARAYASWFGNPWQQQITTDLLRPAALSSLARGTTLLPQSASVWPAARTSSSAVVVDLTDTDERQQQPGEVPAHARIKPLLRPQLTDDEHPLGEGITAWPFNVRAYYVGEPEL